MNGHIRNQIAMAVAEHYFHTAEYIPASTPWTCALALDEIIANDRMDEGIQVFRNRVTWRHHIRDEEKPEIITQAEEYLKEILHP